MPESSQDGGIMSNLKRSFSKDCLSDALLMLMNTKPASEITIQEITDKAGVSRATWFRNFTDKREAVVYNLMRKWERWADAHDLKEPGKISLANVDAFVAYIYEIRSVRSALLRSDMASAILDSFLMVLVREKYEAPSPDFFTLQFMTYGLTGLVCAWAETDYSIDRETMSDYIRMFITRYYE